MSKRIDPTVGILVHSNLVATTEILHAARAMGCPW